MAGPVCGLPTLPKDYIAKNVVGDGSDEFFHMRNYKTRETHKNGPASGAELVVTAKVLDKQGVCNWQEVVVHKIPFAPAECHAQGAWLSPTVYWQCPQIHFAIAQIRAKGPLSAMITERDAGGQHPRDFIPDISALVRSAITASGLTPAGE